MRYLVLLFLFISALCHGQDTISNKTNNRKIGNPGDKFIFSVNAGLNFPEGDYGNNLQNFTNYQTTYPEGYVYGYSNDGFHIDLNGIYIVSPRIGVALKFGMDENNYYYGNSFKLSSRGNKIFQYQSGIYLSINPVESKFNITFIGLIGIATAHINISNNYDDPGTGEDISSSVNPGAGSGLGFYGGIAFTIKLCRKFCLDISTGYLGASVNFPNSIVTTYYYNYTSNPNGTSSVSTTNSDMKMNLGIIQTNLGISFHL